MLDGRAGMFEMDIVSLLLTDFKAVGAYSDHPARCEKECMPRYQ